MRAKHPLCRTHHKEALDHDPRATREDYYRAESPLACAFCRHDAAMLDLANRFVRQDERRERTARLERETRAVLESAERRWATGRE